MNHSFSTRAGKSEHDRECMARPRRSSTDNLISMVPVSLAAPQREALLRASRPYSPSFIDSRAPNVKVNLLLHQWLPPSLPARFYWLVRVLHVLYMCIKMVADVLSNVPSLFFFFTITSALDMLQLMPTSSPLQMPSHTAGGDMANELLIRQ